MGRCGISRPETPFAALIDFYLSPEHRDEVGDGCPVVALGSDVARHGTEVKASFEAGIEAHLKVLDSYMPVTDGQDARDKSMAVLATMVGALLLSRAVDDQALSKGFLASAKEAVRRVAAA